jgi:hypothetical protein
MNNTREEADKSLDKIISTAHDIKRRFKMLSDKQCSIAFHQVSHEIIDERMTKIKHELGLFIQMDSMINQFLDVTNVKPRHFFKKENHRKVKKPAHGRAKDYIIDARRVFCYIFKGETDDVLSRYLNTSRSSIVNYKKVCKVLIEGNKRFREYYENIIKKLNLDA